MGMSHDIWPLILWSPMEFCTLHTTKYEKPGLSPGCHQHGVASRQLSHPGEMMGAVPKEGSAARLERDAGKQEGTASTDCIPVSFYLFFLFFFFFFS